MNKKTLANKREIEKRLNRKAKNLAYDLNFLGISQNRIGVVVYKLNKQVFANTYSVSNDMADVDLWVETIWICTQGFDKITTQELLPLYLNQDREWLYINPRHGMELDSSFVIKNVYGSGTEYRGNENGILFYAEYIQCRREFEPAHYAHFNAIVDRLEVVPGLFDRGAFESLTVDYKERRSISHDNISAISSLTVESAVDIYKYGKRHAFIYNNVKPLTRYPMNPGNYSIWAYNGGSNIVWLLFLPFYLINLLITCCKAKENTSSKLIYFVELYALRHTNGAWKFMWQVYEFFMQRMYGYSWLFQLTKIYFKDSNHPIRQEAEFKSLWI